MSYLKILAGYLPGLMLLGTLGCGALGKHTKASGPTPQAQTPKPSKTFDLLLSAGVTVVSRLSAGEPCLPVYTATVGGMLHTPGQASDGDDVHFAYDPQGNELELGVEFEGQLTHEVDLFPKNQQQDVLESALKSGKILRVTRQPACSTGTDADSVVLVDFVDLFPEVFNPSVKTLGFPSLKTPTSFGVTFSYDSTLAWKATYETSLAETDVASMPARIQFAVYDSEAMAMVVPWQEMDRGALIHGEIKITDPAQLRRMLPSQRHLELIFDTGAQDAAVPAVFILYAGELCAKQPALFDNLTQSGKTCSQVTDSDLPKS